GYHTVQAAAVVGAGGKVVAFEPNPAVRELLMRGITRNGFGDRVVVESVALAESVGEAKLYLPIDPTNTGIASLDPWQGHLEAGRLRQENTVTVATEPFDRAQERLGLARLDVIKIDVEGAEERVIRGMTASLARFRPRSVVIETSLDAPVV